MRERLGEVAAPAAATAAAIWPLISWSWVGRGDGPEDADRNREVRPEHPRQHQREIRLLGLSSWTSRSASVTPFSPIVTTSGWRPSEPDALVAVLAEDHRLAVLEHEHPVLADLAVGEVAPGAVVEDVAVLEDLDERRAVVAAGPLERLLEVLGVGVDRAGDERRLGGEGDRQRLIG